jgi:hypothetical protein
MKQETQRRGRKPTNPQDVKNLRFQLAFSQNQINAVGGRENAYKLLKKAIEC